MEEVKSELKLDNLNDEEFNLYLQSKKLYIKSSDGYYTYGYWIDSDDKQSCKWKVISWQCLYKHMCSLIKNLEETFKPNEQGRSPNQVVISDLTITKWYQNEGIRFEHEF